MTSKKILGLEIATQVPAAVSILDPAVDSIPVLVVELTLVQEVECIVARAVECTQGREEVYIPAPVVDFTQVQEEAPIRVREEDYTPVQVVACIRDPVEVFIQGLAKILIVA